MYVKRLSKIELRVFEEVISFLIGASKVAQSPSL